MTYETQILYQKNMFLFCISDTLCLVTVNVITMVVTPVLTLTYFNAFFVYIK